MKEARELYDQHSERALWHIAERMVLAATTGDTQEAVRLRNLARAVHHLILENHRDVVSAG